MCNLKTDLISGDRVRVSDISMEAAETSPYTRFLFIGIDTDGKYVVEGKTSRTYSSWKYAVLYVSDKKYYVKSIQDTVKALLEHNFHFVPNMGFICEGYDFQFGLNDWSWCGKEISSREIADGLGFPTWMIDVIEEK